MNPTVQKILDDILALPVEEQRFVMEAVLGSLPPETADAMTEEAMEGIWMEEAQRRVGQLERGEVQALDGEAALSALETKLRTVHAT
jgi:hypothetical protein